jgi:hypothetical protein
VFFTFMPPYDSALVNEANGANVEPFLYVVALWFLRERPLWFGALLGVGFLNREFTIYAVPVLIAIQCLDRSLFRADRLRAWLLTAVAFLAVWQTVQVVKPLADAMGPGTRGRPPVSSNGSTVDNLLARSSVDGDALADRFRAMVLDYFPRQIGARRIESETGRQGRDWLRWPMLGVLALLLVRALALAWRRRGGTLTTPWFGWYLVGVGLLAAAGYALTRPLGDPIDRYMLLTIYLPVGLVAVSLATEPRVAVRRTVLALVVAWAGFSAADHARLLSHYWHDREPDYAQEMADAMVARGVKVSAAGYWRAYKLTFLSGERVQIASTDVTRITRYDWLAQQEGDQLLVLRPEPCAGEPPLVPGMGWYLCRDGQ